VHGTITSGHQEGKGKKKRRNFTIPSERERNFPPCRDGEAKGSCRENVTAGVLSGREKGRLH